MSRLIHLWILTGLCCLFGPEAGLAVNLVVSSFNADTVGLPRGTPVAVAGPNGGFIRACNTNIAFGMLNLDAPIGSRTDVTVNGIVSLTDWTTVSGSSLLVPGTFYFTSGTLGRITTSPSAGSQIIGISLSSLDLSVNPGYTNATSGGGGTVTLTGAVTGSGTTTIATLLASAITNQWRIDATNNDLAISNAINAIITSVSNSLWLSASNLVWQGTNGLGSAAFTLTSAYDAAGTALSATNKLMKDATNTFIQITVAQALTNNFATIPFAESLTNSFATISYVNTATNNFITTANAQALTNNFETTVAAQALTNNFATISYVNSATNNFITTANAQALTNSFDTIVDVNAKTNLLDTIVDVTAKLASATNNALALATNNDTLTSQITTNTARLAINLASSFDVSGSALTSTNVLYQQTQPGFALTTKITTPASGISYASPMVFGNGMFVQVIGDGSTFAEVLYSTDGRNWATNFTMPASNSIWKSLVYGGNQFVAIASNTATFASSSDGLHWTARNAAGIDSWSSVGYGNGVYAICSAGSSTSAFETSQNGQNWSSGSSINSVTLRALTFGGQQWVVVGDGGKIYTSPTAQTWAIQTSPNSSSWTGVTYGNGLYVAWASAGTTAANSLITSTDGTNWGAQTISFAGPDSISYGSGVFVGYKGGTGAMVSNDGTNWTSVTGTISGRVNGNTFGNGLFAVSSGTETQTSGKPITTLDVSGNILQGGLIVRGDITNAAQTSKDALASDSNGKLIAASAIQMTHIAQPGVIVTNGETQAITVSNIFTADAGHYFSGPGSFSVITNTGLTTVDAEATDSNGKEIGASAILMSHISQPGTILTNGGTFSATWSNVFSADAAHYLSGIASFSAITNTGLTSADGVATDSNGKLIGATALLMSHIAQPGAIVTNGNSFALTLSNNTTIDASHTLTAAGGATLGTATISSGGNLAAANVAWSGTNVGNITSATNNQVAAQSANYSVLLSDYVVPLNGARTATLPTAVGIPGKVFTVWCATSGTNAILTTSSQTINGAAKWTNTAQFKFTTVMSDGANWRVIGQN